MVSKLVSNTQRLKISNYPGMHYGDIMGIFGLMTWINIPNLGT